MFNIVVWYLLSLNILDFRIFINIKLEYLKNNLSLMKRDSEALIYY